MEYESIIISLDSTWFKSKKEDNDMTTLQWELPCPVFGSNVSLSSYSLQSPEKHKPIKICCNLIRQTWQNPDSSFGDVYNGKAICADDRWEMNTREYRTLKIM
jgi:hypothetical protein